MQLRNHPLMLFRGRRNWPPAWIWGGTGMDEQPRGEIGALHDIQIFKVDRRVVLLMALHDTPYVGCLRFDETEKYERIGAILRRQIGRSIKEIGDLDLSALLTTDTPPEVTAAYARSVGVPESQARKR